MSFCVTLAYGKGFLELPGILKMLGISGCKTVGTVEGRIRAEEDVAVGIRVQDGLQAALGRA